MKKIIEKLWYILQNCLVKVFVIKLYVTFEQYAEITSFPIENILENCVTRKNVEGYLKIQFSFFHLSVFDPERNKELGKSPMFLKLEIDVFQGEEGRFHFDRKEL